MSGSFKLRRSRLWHRAARTAVAGAAVLGSVAALAVLPPAASAAPADKPGPVAGPDGVVPGMAGPRPAAGRSAAAAPGGLPGIDVSHYQGNINWGAVKGSGIKFAFIKATESTNYIDPKFGANYPGAHGAGVIRGAYHFARLGASSGGAQANYFADHGGAWSADNLTLPGVVDLEGSCDRNVADTKAWIHDFYNTYKARTGRDVIIYTSASWWNRCAGGTNEFAAKTPLWVASWTSAGSPTMPSGFGGYTFWQWTDKWSVGGISGAVDGDVFNGSDARLLALANNTA